MCSHFYDQPQPHPVEPQRYRMQPTPTAPGLGHHFGMPPYPDMAQNQRDADTPNRRNTEWNVPNQEDLSPVRFCRCLLD